MKQDEIGKIIKELRQKDNLSQQKFAAKYGVTYQAVSKWENGKNMPDISILKQICEDHNMNLDDFLEAKKTDRKNKKNIFIISLIVILIIISTITLILVKNHDDPFEFKTLAPTCDNFKLYGSIAYNNNKSSIYISNISYCGTEDKRLYTNINCTLYEQSDKTTIEISEYKYQDNVPIKLEDFLKEVNFNIDNYEKKCNTYKDNSLYLEIEATTKEDETITYKIPLRLEENCSK